MKGNLQPEPNPQGSCPPPEPPGGTNTDGPTPQTLVYRAARSCGLADIEAREVVQETGLSAAKCVANGKFNPGSGSLKAWVLQLARWRSADKLRAR
jgi:DNA-directed RNA polymerase specialized sigma24 family protein